LFGVLIALLFREGRLDVVEAEPVASLRAADDHYVPFVIDPVGSEVASALVATNGLPEPESLLEGHPM
jgi:hypothetical protein